MDKVTKLENDLASALNRVRPMQRQNAELQEQLRQANETIARMQQQLQSGGFQQPSNQAPAFGFDFKKFAEDKAKTISGAETDEFDSGLAKNILLAVGEMFQQTGTQPTQQQQVQPQQAQPAPFQQGFLTGGMQQTRQQGTSDAGRRAVEMSKLLQQGSVVGDFITKLTTDDVLATQMQHDDVVQACLMGLNNPESSAADIAYYGAELGNYLRSNAKVLGNGLAKKPQQGNNSLAVTTGAELGGQTNRQPINSGVNMDEVNALQQQIDNSKNHIERYALLAKQQQLLKAPQ